MLDAQLASRFSFGCYLTWANRSPRTLLLIGTDIVDLDSVCIVQRRTVARKRSITDYFSTVRYASQAALGRSRRLPERLWEKPGDVLYFWQAYFDDREQLELALAVLAAYGVAAQVLEIFPVGPEWRVIRGGFRRTAGHASWGGHWLLDANEIKHVSDVVKWCLVNELTANLTGALRAFLAACTAL